MSEELYKNMQEQGLGPKGKENTDHGVGRGGIMRKIVGTATKTDTGNAKMLPHDPRSTWGRQGWGAPYSRSRTRNSHRSRATATYKYKETASATNRRRGRTAAISRIKI